MKNIPVLLEFDHSKQIGTLTIDTDKLPPIPEFCFSIGYKALTTNIQDRENWELVCVSVVMDDNYKKYLDMRP